MCHTGRTLSPSIPQRKVSNVSEQQAFLKQLLDGLADDDPRRESVAHAAAVDRDEALMSQIAGYAHTKYWFKAELVKHLSKDELAILADQGFPPFGYRDADPARGFVVIHED